MHAGCSHVFWDMALPSVVADSCDCTAFMKRIYAQCCMSTFQMGLFDFPLHMDLERDEKMLGFDVRVLILLTVTVLPMTLLTEAKPYDVLLPLCFDMLAQNKPGVIGCPSSACASASASASACDMQHCTDTKHHCTRCRTRSNKAN